jgi:hypothetical protein
MSEFPAFQCPTCGEMHEGSPSFSFKAQEITEAAMHG